MAVQESLSTEVFRLCRESRDLAFDEQSTLGLKIVTRIETNPQEIVSLYQMLCDSKNPSAESLFELVFEKVDEKTKKALKDVQFFEKTMLASLSHEELYEAISYLATKPFLSSDWLSRFATMIERNQEKMADVFIDLTNHNMMAAEFLGSISSQIITERVSSVIGGQYTKKLLSLSPDEAMNVYKKILLLSRAMATDCEFFVSQEGHSDLVVQLENARLKNKADEVERKIELALTQKNIALVFKIIGSNKDLCNRFSETCMNQIENQVEALIGKNDDTIFAIVQELQSFAKTKFGNESVAQFFQILEKCAYPEPRLNELRMRGCLNSGDLVQAFAILKNFSPESQSLFLKAIVDKAAVMLTTDRRKIEGQIQKLFEGDNFEVYQPFIEYLFAHAKPELLEKLKSTKMEIDMKKYLSTYRFIEARNVLAQCLDQQRKAEWEQEIQSVQTMVQTLQVSFQLSESTFVSPKKFQSYVAKQIITMYVNRPTELSEQLFEVMKVFIDAEMEEALRFVSEILEIAIEKVGQIDEIDSDEFEACVETVVSRCQDIAPDLF